MCEKEKGGGKRVDGRTGGNMFDSELRNFLTLRVMSVVVGRPQKDVYYGL